QSRCVPGRSEQDRQGRRCSRPYPCFPAWAARRPSPKSEQHVCRRGESLCRNRLRERLSPVNAGALVQPPCARENRPSSVRIDKVSCHRLLATSRSRRAFRTCHRQALTGTTLAAVLSQVAQQRVHRVVSRGIDHGAPVTPNRDEASPTQSVKVKRQRIRRELER